MLVPKLAGVLSVLVAQAQAFFSVNDDLQGSPKYVISYNDQHIISNDEISKLDNNSFTKVMRNGNEYICQLPAASRTKAEDSRLLLDDSIDFHSIVKGSFNGTCVLYTYGYWSYIVCPETEIAQFHGSHMEYFKENPLKFVLGRFKKPANERKLSLDKRGEQWYLREIVDGGTLCDVTRKPRTSEIHYVCDPKVKAPTINWVKEYKSCGYLFQVSIPELCEFEFLKTTQAEQTNEVVCRKKLSEAGPGLGEADLLSLNDYKLYSLSHHVFLAEPLNSTNTNLVSLLYTSPDENNLLTDLMDATVIAIKRNLLKLSDGTAISNENVTKFSFNCHVYDHRRNFLTTVQINLSNGLLNITGWPTKNEITDNFSNVEHSLVSVERKKRKSKSKSKHINKQDTGTNSDASVNSNANDNANGDDNHRLHDEL